MGLKIGGKVEKVNGKELSYRQFVERYLQKNEPVVFTGLMDGWRACHDWVTDTGHPNLHFFSTHFGESKVQVAECSRRQFTDQKRVEMSVSEFFNYWIGLSSRESIHDDYKSDKPVLYLKDWHFVKEYQNYVAYTTPSFFLDDWLNLYLDTRPMHTDSRVDNDKIDCSDYRFVYIGPKGSWTPLHADVFRSYSWSANVCGRKKWHFLSPSQAHLIFDRNMKNSVYDIFSDVSEIQFPGFKKAVWLECTQEKSEIIFVPSGWFHQVHNMEDTISINHNWFNAYNLSCVWNLLLKDYNEAVENIEDIRDICDDFEGLCQRNLAANSGMNFLDFFFFIMRFSVANLILLHHLVRNREISIFSHQYLLANLVSICKVASSMTRSAPFNWSSMRSLWVESQYAISCRGNMLEESDFTELCVVLSKTYGALDLQMEVELSVSDTNRLVVGLSKTDFWNLHTLEAFESRLLGPEALIRFITDALKDVSSMASDRISSLIKQTMKF